MIAKKLRNSVLQLAVQGRLVPQDPADEPASVLLEKIRAEKRALVRAGKLKKGTAESTVFRGSPRIKGTEAGRFYEKDGAGKIADITDALPFAIPESWEWVRLGQVVKSLTDGTHVTPKYVDSSGVPFLSVKNISSGKVDFSNCKYITEEEHRILYKRCNPEFGDILLTKVGTTGIPALVDTKREFSLFVSVALIKIFSHRLSSKFIVFELQSPLVQEQARINTKGVGNKNWVMRDIAKTLLPLPPLAEQERIVSALETLLPKISEYEKSETKIYQINSSFPEKLKKSVLQAAIQGRLVPQDPADEPASVLLEKIRAEKRKLLTNQGIKKEPRWASIENLKALPKGWAWCRLGEICIKIGSGSTPRGGKGVYSPSGIPFLRSQNIFDDGIRLKNVVYISEDIHKSMSSTEVHPKDILLNITGASLGRCALVSDNFPSANVSQHVTIIRLIDERLRFYIHKLLLSPILQSMIWSRQVGMAREGLSKRTLQQFEIPLPPLAEQNRIVWALDDILAKISPLSGPNEKFSVGL